jgi:two-component system, OmpR family, sensor kinase
VTGRDDASETGRAHQLHFRPAAGVVQESAGLLNDVGHEPKTPITMICGHLKLLDAANVSDVEWTRAPAIDEIDRMSTLV